MGASSYVLRGYDGTASLCSACHGAGRLGPRQQGRDPATRLEPLRVVTKVDHRRLRRDVCENWECALMEEGAVTLQGCDAGDRHSDVGGHRGEGRAALAAADGEGALIGVGPVLSDHS